MLLFNLARVYSMPTAHCRSSNICVSFKPDRLGGACPADQLDADELAVAIEALNRFSHDSYLAKLDSRMSLHSSSSGLRLTTEHANSCTANGCIDYTLFVFLPMVKVTWKRNKNFVSLESLPPDPLKVDGMGPTYRASNGMTHWARKYPALVAVTPDGSFQDILHTNLLPYICPMLEAASAVMAGRKNFASSRTGCSTIVVPGCTLRWKP